MARSPYPANVKDTSDRSDPVQPVAVIGFYLDPDVPMDPIPVVMQGDGGEPVPFAGLTNEQLRTSAVPVSVAPLGAVADVAWTGSGGGSVIAILKALFAGIANLAPARAAAAVAPSDSVNLGTPSRALWVGSAGNVSVVIGGQTVVFTAVPAGSRLDVTATRVNLTGTTAGNIVALS